MTEDNEFLDEERHLAVLFRLRAERIIKLIDTKRARGSGGIPDVLLEKDRELLGVAAILWVALHPAGDEPGAESARAEALKMIHMGMGSPVDEHSEEEYTRHLVDHENFSDWVPKTGPVLKAEDGGNQDPFEIWNKLGNIQFKSEKPNLTIQRGGKSGDNNSK